MNPDQLDSDEDGLGDACDVCPFDPTNDGSDGDGVCDDVDNCLGVANHDQLDSDGDGAGNACDVCPFDPTDDGSDEDGVCDDVDNCVGLYNPDQTDFNDDGVGDACTPCEPDPHTQGYFHRQCMGIPASEGGIDPGRNGRGPTEVNEPDFDKAMTLVSAQLELRFGELGGACAGGMDAAPPDDKCEKAIKQSTAVLFNLVTSRLSGSCPVDLSAEGCTSDNLTDLVQELADLIAAGECQTASDCAAAVNEGTAVVEALALAHSQVNVDSPATNAESPAAPPPTGGTSMTPAREAPAAVVTPSEVPVDGPRTPSVVAGVPAAEPSPQPEAPEVSAEEAEPVVRGTELALEEIRQHQVVLAGSAASAEERAAAMEALLTALSGGYEPEVRLEIVNTLLPVVDAGLRPLLAEHLEALQLEAEELGMAGLADEAARLRKILEGPAD